MGCIADDKPATTRTVRGLVGHRILGIFAASHAAAGPTALGGLDSSCWNRGLC